MSETVFKNRLKVLRAEKNITQDVLADSIGVTRKTINTIETGKFVPTAITALKIAAFFNVKVEDVFYIEGNYPCGIFRILNLRNGRTLLVPSVNIPSSIERHRAELNKGSHKNIELQKDWNEFGPENFLFDIVTVLNESDKIQDADAELKKLMEKTDNDFSGLKY